MTDLRLLDVFKFILRGSRFARQGTPPVPRRTVAKHLVAGLLHRRTLKQWLTDGTNPALHEALKARPSLIRCVARPYLNVRWRARRKFQVIRDHYRLVSDRLPVLRFPASSSVYLGTAYGCVEVRLEKPGWAEHEGELTLSLFSGSTRLYALAFTLGQDESGAVAYVGALQGLGRGDALATYRTLTRRMDGLRPRDLLISAFRALCVSIDVDKVYAISDEACVGRSTYFGTPVRLFSSYDLAWQENGGVRGTDGFFELNPHFARRPITEIPSRKRAQYRRRYEMLEALRLQISSAVQRAGSNLAAMNGALGAVDPNSSFVATSADERAGPLRPAWPR